jgi:hypothetical protein
MNLSELTRPLSIDEIDFRVQSVNNGGYATILAYKDARADMIRLDAAVGPLGWKREHVNGNANCIVSIYDKDNEQWVSKEDTGTESYSEANKGLASDSFKRACFNWGIGRELYDYPLITVKLFDNEISEKNGKKTANWNFKLKEWTWFSQFNEDGKITYLAAKDQNGKKRFAWGTFDKSLEEQKSEGVQSNSEPTVEDVNEADKDFGNPEGLLKKKAEKPEPVEEKHDEPVEEKSEQEKEREALMELYEEIYGKKPSSRIKTDTLREKVAEGMEAKKDYEEADVEEVDVEEAVEIPLDPTDIFTGDLAKPASLIPSFTSLKEFTVWARGVLASHPEAMPEHVEIFKKMCNEHATKISK